MKKTILFVCTGNTCRSPMAQMLFSSMIAEEGLDTEYRCASAGIYAFEGDPASLEAVKASAQYGLDLSNHYARILEFEMIRESYRILTMTREHKKMILEVFPEASDKVYTLKEYAEYNENDWDIPDPFGFDETIYMFCLKELEEALFKVLKKL